IVHTLIEANVWVAWLVLLGSFAILAKCADIFVESAVSLAYKFKLPKLVVGIVLVAFATTAPELAVSMISALRGNAQIALGNAVGSVLCNTGLGLSLCALFVATSVTLAPRVIKQTGSVVLGVGVLAFLFTALDASLQRWEGAILVLAFCIYMMVLFYEHKGGKMHDEDEWENIEAHTDFSISRLTGLFVLGLAGILFTSNLIVTSATTIAHALHIPQGIIALTLVAFGTSVPEVATCVAAARKHHAALAVGNIMGANIMNICWVAGASSLINDLTLTHKEIFFMFPAMLVVIITAQVLLWRRWRLVRWHGALLLGLYIVYLLASFLVFRPGT
ncbi:MAG: calcium/sodium antiporter, partial [Kiritimatiellia bacterium]|nr:calcium/sodium antiporter [Kiritimatiellia bacterium]